MKTKTRPVVSSKKSRDRETVVVSRVDLLKRLHSVRPGLSEHKDTAEQSSCFAFQDGDVITFNDEVSCRMTSGLPDTFTGVVMANPILQLLSKMKEQEVEVSFKDGQIDIYGSRKSLSELYGNREIAMNLRVVEKPAKWTKLPNDFAEALKLTTACAINKGTVFVFCCLHFHPDYIEACDNRQYIRYAIKMGIKSNFLIRHEAFERFTGLDVSEYALTDTWFHLRNPDGLIVSCRKYSDKYPDMSAALFTGGSKLTMPKGVSDILEKTNIFTVDNAENRVNVLLTPGKMQLKGRGPLGSHSDEMPADYTGAPIDFTIAPTMLAEMEKHGYCYVHPKGRLMVKEKHFSYVCCLSRPKNPQEGKSEEY